MHTHIYTHDLTHSGTVADLFASMQCEDLMCLDASSCPRSFLLTHTHTHTYIHTRTYTHTHTHTHTQAGYDSKKTQYGKS
jgi:hypothetical protein